VHGDQLWDENSCLRTADLTDAPFSNGSVTIVVFRVGYLRRMLIHGARAVLLCIKYDTRGFGQWVHRLAQRAPRNRVVVAIANKLARLA
jgi:hypothetical protein